MRKYVNNGASLIPAQLGYLSGLRLPQQLVNIQKII